MTVSPDCFRWSPVPTLPSPTWPRSFLASSPSNLRRRTVNLTRDTPACAECRSSPAHQFLTKLHLLLSPVCVAGLLCLTGWLLSCAPHVPRCPAPPPSDESDYHTDYEEEALESALSDLELSNHAGDHTEGEETADTVGSQLTSFASCALKVWWPNHVVCFSTELCVTVGQLTEKTPV